MAKRNPPDQKLPASLSRGSPTNCAVQRTAPSPLFPEEPQSQRMRMDYVQFISLMESFGITDRGFISPLYSQLIEADGFGGDGVNSRRRSSKELARVINSRLCLAPRWRSCTGLP
jgi:hypothetical protein